jgi:hypothetical protein
MEATTDQTTLHPERYAQLFATRFSGASLVERDAAEAVAGALHIVDVSARITAEMLSWDNVVAPFGSVMLRLSQGRSAVEGDQ